MAAWISRGMDKFLCEDFGLSSIDTGAAHYVSEGKNVYRVAYVDQSPTKALTVWRYNIKENLPWKELCSFACDLPAFLRLDVDKVFLRDGEIFVFFRQHFGLILYEFVPVYSLSEDRWTVPDHRGYEVPRLDSDSVYRSACRVGDKYIIYSSASFENLLDFREREHGGTGRYDNVQEIPPHDNPIRFYSFDLATREWTSLETHLIGFRQRDVLRMGQAFLGSRLMPGPDGKTAYLFNERAFHNFIEAKLNDAYRLDLETKEWTKVRVTGDVPDRVQPSVVLKGHVYMFGCCGEPPSQLGNLSPWELQCDVIRFDAAELRWDLIEAAGESPARRRDAQILAVDGKIVIVGGYGPRNLARLRRKDGFWFRGNEYDLSCRCNYCWDMELTGEPEGGEFESDEEEEKVKGVGGGAGIGKGAVLAAGEEARACFDSAAAFSDREIAHGERQVRQALENVSLEDARAPPANAAPVAEAATEASASGATADPSRSADAADRPVGADSVANAFAERVRTSLRQIPEVKLTEEELKDVRFKFLWWQMKNDPLASSCFYDVHVLDLSPSLKTLALVSIADSKVDTSYLPPNLHLNLNTMYAFDPEGKKMPALSETEWEMLVYGKGDFRWNLVKTLKEIGAYDGGLVKLFMMEKFLERA